MDKDTLYDLRSLLALYPYYQPARLLMLKNLFLLHDNTFDEELRRAALYITDRTQLFDLVERAHYQTRKPKASKTADEASKTIEQQDRTTNLIDDFLNSMPDDDKPDESKTKRKLTPADAAVDYIAYMLWQAGAGSDNEEKTEQKPEDTEDTSRTANLINDFLNNDGGKIELQEEPKYTPQIEENGETTEKNEEAYFTETLAKIYIKQGRYSKAKEIIQRINLNNPKKNIYFADQIRFLDKLIINQEAGENKNKK